ncbi:unnamed protein product [Dicrocoelium dendriticum]|nr:unnamed protein product [Dicrocoelium dendriticum]
MMAYFINMLVIVMLFTTQHHVEAKQLATCAQGCSDHLKIICAVCPSQKYEKRCEAEVDLYYWCLKACKEPPMAPGLALP